MQDLQCGRAIGRLDHATAQFAKYVGCVGLDVLIVLNDEDQLFLRTLRDLTGLSLAPTDRFSG